MAHTNRLALETSPYLLQHAHNPVDWYAWGPEAFEAARAQNKPIFLSVGYSTCYWCHVMERECFENESIAAEMNQRFINIKVDREERPDIDSLYMTAVQVLTRHGGWPMSVFLLPDLRPFYGGTYFPPTDAHGRPGFVTVLRAIDDAFHNRTKDVQGSAEQITSILGQLAKPAGPSRKITIDRQFINELIRRSTSDYDPANGGFGSAPKFPRETLLELLLVSEKAQIENPKSQIRHSLDAMANGGIRDHLGGGFHRYSTDAQWLVPHFEIMLYDNAMLGWCYVEAYRQTKEQRYARVARGIFDFILREMTSPDGAFYTAMDAEVDAQEGGSYLWTSEQIESILDASDAELFSRVYGLDRGTNFRDPHHPGPEKNVLYLPTGPSLEDDPRVVTARQKLYEARRKRKQPLLDTKIITSWNALMIRAMAHGAKVLKDEKYLAAAPRVARFLWENHRGEDGTLYRTSRDGVKKHAAFLDDYAFLAQAFLELGGEWRDRAFELVKIMNDQFADENGGFFFTAKDAPDLVVRQKIGTDSPLPSGSGVAAMVLLELGDRETAKRLLSVFAHQIDQQGEGMSAMVQAAMEYVRKFGSIEVPGTGATDERPLSPQELAQRVVNIAANWIDPTKLELRLAILKSFHINSNQPPQDMIPTELRFSDHLVDSIEYPPGSTWEGQASIIVKLKDAPDSPLRGSLRYQACDESACLPEVTAHFEVPTP